MRICRLVGFVAVVFLAGCVQGGSGSSATHLVLEDVNIVDVDLGEVMTGRSILISDGLIAEIASAPRPSWPRVAERPDVAGAFVSPALIDSHIHIFDERDLAMYSTYGVAFVRNMDGWEWHRRLQKAARKPAHSRADFVTVGSQFQSSNFMSVDEMLTVIDTEAARGFEWTKLYDDFDAQSLAAVSELKKQRALRVTGHLPDGRKATELISSGVYDDIAHAEELMAAMRFEFGDWRSGVEAVAATMRATKTALSTTIVNNKMIVEQMDDMERNLNRSEVRYAAPILQVFWASQFNPYGGHQDHGSSDGEMTNPILELMEMTKALHELGVVILAGTDAPNPTTVPGASLHEELSLLVKAGLSPQDALRSATSVGGDHLSDSGQFGRLRNGAAADMILTAKNPLSDISEISRFTSLVRSGRYAPASAVMLERETLAQAYENDREILEAFSPESAQAILDAISASGANPPISREGLTSLVWVYMKFGNVPEALRVADQLIGLFPDEREAIFVHEFISTL